MKNNKEKMIPSGVSESAERQLINLKKAQDDKMKEMAKEREYVVELKRTIQALIYAAGNAYKSVFPGAEGFIEGRIKSFDSITTKARNEFTEILSEIKEKPDINQKSILEKISKVDFKDIIAFSVITSVPPKKFKTGSDELNSKLIELSEELEKSSHRISEHETFAKISQERVLDLSNQIRILKEKLAKAMSREEKEKIIKEKILTDYNPQEMLDLINNLDKETISEELANKSNELNIAKENVEYGQSNVLRTKDVYTRNLRDLQYEMSAYFVSNLSKFSTFKFWGTEEIREPKTIKKPGFRAVNTGYSVVFSNNNDKCKVKFEAQGKGELDYNDGEFMALGAGYHEEQKTKDGLISKRTEMPDFTIIGAQETERIEKSVRRKYNDITSIEDLGENLEDKDMKKEYEDLKRYEKKVISEMNSIYGKNALTKKEIRQKMHEAFNASKENLIQKEIEKKINEKVYEFSNSTFIKEKIKSSKSLTELYNKEKEKLENSDKRELTQAEIEQEARVKVLYHVKEKEISDYAKNAIPMFFRANLSSNQDEVIVYWFSTGESIHRYFINRLDGLKDENGKYKYEPQQQQKKALLKLTGLFEEDESNFYTYNQETESFGSIRNMSDDIEK